MMVNNREIEMVKKSLISTLFSIQLLFNSGAFAQSEVNVMDFIRQRFEYYSKSVPWEEIYLHTDREDYIAGEELWFKIFLIDRQSSSVSLRSSIAYFELLNAENRPVVQKRFRLTNGSGPGKISLPDTLSTGMYTIRVYTSWMKNFLPVNCFMKDLNIYNPFNIKTFKRKVYDHSASNKVTAIESDSATPVNHLKIKTERKGSGDHEIIIYTDSAFRSENNGPLYLFIQAHGNVDRFTSELIAVENTRITIPFSSLTPGINQITVFDSKGKPISEKLIYTPSTLNKKNLTIHSTDSFSTRSKISLEIDLPASANNQDLTVSVAPIAKTAGMTGIDDYLLFGSEYGFLPHRTISGRKMEELTFGEKDSLLSDLKSSWLNWEKILSDDKPGFEYRFEKEWHQIGGLLLAEGQQLAYPGEKVVMSTPGKSAQFQYAVTSHEGKFAFLVPIEDNIMDLIMQPVDTQRNYRIFIESSFPDQYYPTTITSDSVPGWAISYISKWSLNYQVGKIYGSSTTGNILFPPAEQLPEKRFYGKPDMELVINNFIKLPTMEEVFFELIPRVRLVKTGREYEIVFLDYSGNRVYEEPPVMMIDGVIYNNASVIARLDPNVVEKIDIVRGIYHVGDFAFHGIVNVITNAGNFLRLSLPDYAVRLSYRVTEPAIAFISPDYSETEARNSRNPDLRNTLYWNPSVKPDKDGRVRLEFWSSDLSSDYCITVQGVSSEGQTFSSRKIIKVSQNY